MGHARDRDCLAAVTDVATDLLGGAERDQVLCRLALRVRTLADADGAAFGIVDDPGWVRLAVAEDLVRSWRGTAVALRGSLPGSVISSGRTERVADPGADPRMAALVRREPRLGATIAAPVVGPSRVRAALLLCRQAGRRGFTATQERLVTSIAGQTAPVLELAEHRRLGERLGRVQDRQRIADELQGQVTKRLFALGLALQGLAGRTNQCELREALDEKVVECDRIIDDIRAAVCDTRR